MSCIKSLLKHIFTGNEPKTETSVDHRTATLAEIPLERIFGSDPEKQIHYPEHRLSSVDTPTLDGSASTITPRRISLTYRDSPRGSVSGIFNLPIIEQSELPSECIENVPALHCLVSHDVLHSTLHIFLLKATNLPNPAASMMTKGVFVTMYLHPSKEEIFESKVVPASQDPVFEQVFEFSSTVTAQDIHKQSVVFLIYRGKKASQGVFCGSVVLPLGEVDHYGVNTIMKIDKMGSNIPCDMKGDVLLSLAYNPAHQQLHGSVSKITNMHTCNQSIADPYVKINLLYYGQRQAQRKTSVKKRTMTPVFNEPFQFDITRMDMDYITLEVIVMDYESFTRDEPVGETSIGKHVPSKSGRSHWAEVMASPHATISHWHSISIGTDQDSPVDTN